ncbi:DEAD/DEAH box helicase [Sporocytophaga myxococcoides]|uniref:DEAD/DEAH box helicase n=1 Tax=Sporocytophaga myxococcoides TaxID=153721 RepID=UPI00041B9EA2|nr:DEAD/DEAH box helicase [Sporocytophaga myxococcoides]
MLSDKFHPAVASWFTQTFSQPTSVQTQAWNEIKKGKSVLIAAPTGSGKTLASFMSAIDDLVKQGCKGGLEDATQVIYISPLKALSNDIERNLQFPLKGISEELVKTGCPDVKIRVGVRTGDTTTVERSSMIRKPPHIIVTTPESLYLLLTSVNGRKILSTVKSVIVDEIHSIVGSKRGSHLSLSLERLQHLTENKLIRIGISATQKPIEKVAEFLMGNAQKRPCKIINTGHKRAMDLTIEVPGSPLTSVMSHEVWGEIYNRLEALILEHKTTLIFVNTRRLAERLALHLTERLGPSAVTAHHGSMSKEQRFDAEQRLKSGSLKALVATSSLELGIDIGFVDLVCQISSPRSIAAFLQRVGRSGHSVEGRPKGMLFPLTRDELLECTAIFDSVRRGELDAIVMPEKPIDILAQQIVAEVASEEQDEDALFEMLRSAYPFRELSRKEYDEIINMLSDGFTTRRGKRGAYIFHDVVNKKLRARKGARLTAIVNGGAIPDNFDFDVIKEPENIFVGTLNEDFAIESLPGDIFQLGNASYRITRIENSKVKVEDAAGQPPSLPFWLGEGPGRTTELSDAVSRVREIVSDLIGEVDEFSLKDDDNTSWKTKGIEWLVKDVGLCEAGADQLVTYLALSKVALGTVPTQKRLVLERFFDEAGDMHLIVHSPFGNRVNRGWGLSLRKRFCKKFNFELQAAATEDAIILSLGSTHSFPLEEVFNYLKEQSVEEILIQALLDSPIFEIRWRWNASVALAVLRRRGGQKMPPQLQRMQSEDLVALVFPDQLACFENIQGEREVPDHPLVNQTIHDCLTEAMDIDLLKDVLKRIEKREVELVAKDLREPSPLAQEILTARPYAFLDDAPLEERRTRAVLSRRWLDASEADDLGRLDAAVIELVKSEAWPVASSPDELQDALSMLGYITEEEMKRGDGRFSWDEFFQVLTKEQRAGIFKTSNGNKLWISIDRIPQYESIYKDFKLTPSLPVPDRLREKKWTKEDALKEIVRGRLEGLGPVTEEELASQMDTSQSDINYAMLTLEQEGFVFRGTFNPGSKSIEWCERRLLSRIHRYTLQKLRKEIEAVSPADFMRYLTEWQGLSSEQAEGPLAVETVLSKLEGFEASSAAWESEILPSRVANYNHTWLDFCCMSGKYVWGRIGKTDGAVKKLNSPIKTTPVMLVSRKNAEVWKYDSGNNNAPELSAKALQVVNFLKERGASFFDDIATGTRLFDSQTEEAIAELVSAGIVSSDSFTGLRALLVPSKYKLESSTRRTVPFTMSDSGRWSLIRNEFHEEPSKDRFLAMTANVLLKRYGVVFRKLAEQELIMPPWRDLVRTFRKMEARGEIRGGRFVDGVWGEQFALPEAVTMLRDARKKELSGSLVVVSAVDPLNLTGVLLPGKRVTGYFGNRILLKDGVPVAVLEGGEVKFLEEFEKMEKWELQNLLIRKNIAPELRTYLGV